MLIDSIDIVIRSPAVDDIVILVLGEQFSECWRSRLGTLFLWVDVAMDVQVSLRR